MNKIESIRVLLRKSDELKVKLNKCDVIIEKTDERFFTPLLNKFRQMKRANYHKQLIETLKELQAVVMAG